MRLDNNGQMRILQVKRHDLASLSVSIWLFYLSILVRKSQ